MQFNSYDFVLFFPLVLLIYFVVPAKFRYIWLLISSYYFYMGWNPKYAILIAFSTIVTYVCGLILERANLIEDEKTKKKRKKYCVATGLLINLAILFVFKYAGFTIESLNAIFAHINIKLIKLPFDIILPVGISFYTFQGLGYIIDVYRGDIKAEKNFAQYALFVSFFPQLVAGPIERSKNLITQLNGLVQVKVWDTKRMANGAVLMLWGYFQKMVIADRVAILVNQVYDNYADYGAMAFILASVFFAIQIYCDFGSYSNIAIGAAEIMGVRLMENFNAPYLATSISNFWKRWHISLSTWFRDYLYIPLGGNRCSKGRKYFNIMVVFLTSGLWHGAAWNYVLWGGLHGLYQIVGDLLKPLKERYYRKFKINTTTKSFRLGQIIITFILVDFAWIFFRASSFSQAINMMQNALLHIDPWAIFDGSLYTWGLDAYEFWIATLSIVLLAIVDIVKVEKKSGLRDIFFRQSTPFRWIVYIGAICAIFLFGIYGPQFTAQEFIYFQF